MLEILYQLRFGGAGDDYVVPDPSIILRLLRTRGWWPIVSAARDTARAADDPPRGDPRPD